MSSFSIRLWADGKCRLAAEGDPAFVEAMRESIRRALDCRPAVSRERFFAAMREHGVPDTVSEEYLATLEIEDETFFAFDRCR